ncbi:MAG: SGNH/GDSL hydrolase family protein, partial [Verrucomicrobiales bacterium]|nr:SGNH/GDSL hydrolase family protein [Verrucomicrobiales bacterium]
MNRFFLRLSLSVFVLTVSFFPVDAAPPDHDPVQNRRGTPNFLAKIKAGQDIHVAFLGGSITQNTKGHTAMIPAWLEEKYPDTDFTFTNAGLSSTCSTTGAFRLYDHVLEKGGIDLLIVEFAVNDDQDAMHSKEQATR